MKYTNVATLFIFNNSLLIRAMYFKSISEFKDYQNQVFTFGPHQYALYFWYEAFENDIIDKNSLLIHIDFHGDFLECAYDAPFTSKVIRKQLDSGKIRRDNYIKPALEDGLIDEIIFCCNPRHINQDYGKFKNYKSPIYISNLLNRLQKYCSVSAN